MLPRAVVDVAVRISDAAAANVDAAESDGSVVLVGIGVHKTLQLFQKQQSNMGQKSKLILHLLAIALEVSRTINTVS